MIQLSIRQQEIVNIIKEHGPITAEDMAERFELSKATLRPDFAFLTRSGIISAKPRVGYYYNGENITSQMSELLSSLLVRDWMGVPTVISPNVSVYDAIVEIFMLDVGSLFIYDDEHGLQGIISRKDLLRVAIGKNDLHAMPISMIMTRMPNIVTITLDDSLLYAARKMELHKIDSLPVVEPLIIDGKNELKVVGRITKTTIVKAFVKIGL